MNKKGIAADDIGPLLFVVIITGLSLVFLFGMSKLVEIDNEKTAEGIEMGHAVRSAVLDYLESSIEYRGEDIRVADFVKTVTHEDPVDKIELFKADADDFFSSRIGIDIWSVEIRFPEDIFTVGGGLIGEGYHFGQVSCTEDKFDYIVSIPTQTNMVNVEFCAFKPGVI